MTPPSEKPESAVSELLRTISECEMETGYDFTAEVGTIYGLVRERDEARASAKAWEDTAHLYAVNDGDKAAKVASLEGALRAIVNRTGDSAGYTATEHEVMLGAIARAALAEPAATENEAGYDGGAMFMRSSVPEPMPQTGKPSTKVSGHGMSVPGRGHTKTTEGEA